MELALQALQALEKLVSRGNHQLDHARATTEHFYENLLSLKCLADALEIEYQSERMEDAEHYDLLTDNYRSIP